MPSTMCLFPDKDNVVGASHRWLSLSPNPRQWKTMMDKTPKAKLFMLHHAAVLLRWARLLGLVSPQFCSPEPLPTPALPCLPTLLHWVQAAFTAGQSHIPEPHLRNGKRMGDGGRGWGQPCDEGRDVTSQGCLLLIIYGQ